MSVWASGWVEEHSDIGASASLGRAVGLARQRIPKERNPSTVRLERQGARESK